MQFNCNIPCIFQLDLAIIGVIFTILLAQNKK